MDPAVQQLIDFISELSEEAYAAGWMQDVEYQLWRRLQDGPGRYGRLDVTPAHILRLRTLSERCRGWVYWHDDTCETFIPLREWTAMYAIWRSRLRPGDLP